MEWVLIAVAILLIFFVSQFLKRYLGSKLKPKTRLLFSFLWFMIFMAYTLTAAKNNFTSFQQFIMMAFSVAYLISFDYRYKKLNQPIIT
jgi:hypothetical protein